MKKKLLVVGGTLALLAAVGSALGGLEDAQKVAEMARGVGKQQSLFDFLKDVPSSFEAQLFYALFGSWLSGAVASWLWKWTQGMADGLRHFTLRYFMGQVMFGVGISIAAIMTVGFQTDSGEFFGWLSVLWSGAFAGFSGETKIKPQVRKVWTDEERAVASAKDSGT